MSYTGIASTDALDLDNDRILSWDIPAEGVAIPLMYEHNTSGQAPVGAAFAKPSKSDDGKSFLSLEFSTFTDTDLGRAVDASINAGTIKSLSVGFSVNRKSTNAVVTENNNNGYDFENVKLTEVSVVLTPANPEAIIDTPTAGSKSATGSKSLSGHYIVDITKSADNESDKHEIDPNTETEPESAPQVEDVAPEKVSADTSEKDDGAPTKAESEDASQELTKSVKNDTMNTTESVVLSKRASAGAGSQQKETTKMVNKSEKKLRSLFTKSINETIAENKNANFSELIQKSVEFDDVDVNYDDVTNILSSGIPSGSDYLDKLPAIAPFNHNINLYTDLSGDDAQALARETGEKTEQVLKMIQRSVTEAEVYVLQKLNYKELKEDTQGKVVTFLMGVMAKQLNVAVQKQILVGNPLLKSAGGTYDVNVDSKIVPIANDSAVFTTQAQIDALTVENVVGALENIKSDGEIIAVMSKNTLNKLLFEKGNDGHYMVSVPTVDVLGGYLGATVQVSDMVPNGQIIAHDINSYQRFSANGGSEYIEGYDINVNKKVIENVALIGGSLTIPQSAVNITVKASAQAQA